MAQDVRSLKLSNVDNVDNISDDWITLWEQIEIWYGDPHKSETGQQFLERMQSMFNLTCESQNSSTSDEALPIADVGECAGKKWNAQYNQFE